MKLCKNPKFKSGKIVATPAAMKMLNDKMISPLSFLQRHQSGDFGKNLCEQDKELNEEAIAHEGNLEKQQRVFSSYKVGKSTLYIITEFDRSVSTLLLPSDY